LADSEKQLVQALLGSEITVRQVLQPLVEQEFWRGAWSWPVLERLIAGTQNLEIALDGIEDAGLVSEVRAAALEPSDSLTVDHVYESVRNLLDAHLSKKKMEISEELKKCGNEAAPADLLKRLQDIQSERNRVANTLKASG
jgi:hypothetical protein